MSADLLAGGYLLDTNVLSELMREAPAPEVLRWFTAKMPSQLYTSTFNQAETLAGIALLAAGNGAMRWQGRPSRSLKRSLLAAALCSTANQRSNLPWSWRSANAWAAPSTPCMPKSPPSRWPRT